MRHSKVFLTPAQALLSVYAPKCQVNVPRRNLVTRRPITAPMPIRVESRNDRIPGPNRSDDKLAAASYKIDNNIEASWVQLRQEDGKLSQPKRLQVLMDEIASSDVVLELSPTSQFPDTAVVRIVDRDELLLKASQKAYILKENQRKVKSSKPKQMELNWAISGNDFEMKLKQMAEFLDKGKRVEILLAPKRKQRRATPEEAQEVIKKLRQTIQDVGAKEIKGMTGAILGQATLTVQKA